MEEQTNAQSVTIHSVKCHYQLPDSHTLRHGDRLGRPELEGPTSDDAAAAPAVGWVQGMIQVGASEASRSDSSQNITTFQQCKTFWLNCRLSHF